MSANPVPLCVNFEGALTPINASDERWVSAIKSFPLKIWTKWFGEQSGIATAGIAANKHDPVLIPIRPELLTWLRAEREAGRRIVLSSTNNHELALGVALNLSLFDEIIGGESGHRLNAKSKCRELVNRFGERGFDYVAGDKSEREVCAASRGVIVVGTQRLGNTIGRHACVTQVIPLQRATARTWVTQLRLYQWVKNLLVLVPAVMAHAIAQPATLKAGLLAFLAFGLCASSVYITNDLFDLNADRRHPRKRFRPFAAGLLSVRSGLFAAPLMLAAAAAVALSVNSRFALILAGYYVLSWAYTLRVKQAALLDVVMLAALYTIRIIAGAAATQLVASFWLLAFSGFIFLSLGFAKRYAELDLARRAGRLAQSERGYMETDLPLITSLGTTSGYCAIIVVALYINSPVSVALYSHSQLLWLVCPFVLYWINRIWLLATRGQLIEDPIVFALQDKKSLIVCAILVLIIVFSI